VALTGDYVADDHAAQGELVQALTGLRAPYGVFGCLGNHEIYTETMIPSYDVKYIGMDVHKEAIVIAVLNEGGKLVMESVIETKPVIGTGQLEVPTFVSSLLCLLIWFVAAIAK